MNFLSLMILLMNLSCPNIQAVNESDLKWTEADSKSMYHNTSRCVVHYKDAPCLVKFVKRGYKNYWAICGEQRP